jgi:hypothetical protein
LGLFVESHRVLLAWPAFKVLRCCDFQLTDCLRVLRAWNSWVNAVDSSAAVGLNPSEGISLFRALLRF